MIGLDGAYSNIRFKRLTYKQADDLANQFANALIARGLRRSDRVLFCCANSVEFFIGLIGAAKAGMVAVPLNIVMNPDVIDHIVNEVEASFLVVDAELYPKYHEVMFANGLNESNTVVIPIGGVVESCEMFSDFVDQQPASEPDVTIHADDIFQILYTAGATSLPKGVMHSHMYVFTGATAYAMSFGRGVPREVDYVAGQFLPMFHVGIIIAYSGLMVGGSVVFSRSLTTKAVLKGILEEQVTTIIAGLPRILYEVIDTLVKNPQLDASSVKVVVGGYGIISPDYHQKLKRVFSPEVQLTGSDGQTECVTDTRWWPEIWQEKYEQHGHATNYFGVSSSFYATTILDESGKVCPPGEVGEKCMRSPCIMSGYYRNPEATKEAFRGDWLHSGDACKYDDDNLIIMLDRFKDIIKTGGETVPSARVEEVLKGHPAVERVAAIGLSHKTRGEAVTACVVLIPGEVATEKELLRFCRDKLARYEIPKKIIFRESLPETLNGKILKYVLRQELEGLYN